MRTLVQVAADTRFLSLQEERYCYACMVLGSQAAFQELVVRHLPHVYQIARKWKGRGVPVDDLINIGTLGLIAAIKSPAYDPLHGPPLHLRSYFQINAAIREHVDCSAGLLRLPRWRDRLKSHSQDQIEQGTRVVSMSLLAEDDNDVSFDPIDAQPGPAENAELAEERERFIALIEQLPERQRDVLYNVYVENMRVGEAGKWLGLTSDQSSVAHRLAIKELRKLLEAKLNPKPIARRFRGEPRSVPFSAGM